jgi:hypothetical protein
VLCAGRLYAPDLQGTDTPAAVPIRKLNRFGDKRLHIRPPKKRHIAAKAFFSDEPDSRRPSASLFFGSTAPPAFFRPDADFTAAAHRGGQGWPHLARPPKPNFCTFNLNSSQNQRVNDLLKF